jgi:hypothetical protein
MRMYQIWARVVGDGLEVPANGACPLVLEVFFLLAVVVAYALGIGGVEQERRILVLAVKACDICSIPALQRRSASDLCPASSSGSLPSRSPEPWSFS